MFQIDMFTEPPEQGLMRDILSSEPMDDFGKEQASDLFSPNNVRNGSYFFRYYPLPLELISSNTDFSYSAVCQFLERTKLLSVLRAHECRTSGCVRQFLILTFSYGVYAKATTGWPAVISIFSTPNYSAEYNVGAVLQYENNSVNICQFHHRKRPAGLPDFKDGISLPSLFINVVAFSWSLPVVDKESYIQCLNISDRSYRNGEGFVKRVFGERAAGPRSYFGNL